MRHPGAGASHFLQPPPSAPYFPPRAGCATRGNACMNLRAVLAFVLSFAFTAHAQFTLKKEYVKPSLLADTTAIVPGQPFTVLVRMEMMPGWHVYWEFGGDSGL